MAVNEIDLVKVCLDSGLDFATISGTLEPDGRMCATITVPDNVANPALNVEVITTDPTLDADDGPLNAEICVLADQSASCASAPGGVCDIKVSTEKGNALVNLVPSGCDCTLVLGAPTLACDNNTDGVDNYTVSIPFDNGLQGAPGAAGYTITTTGTVGGDNPMMVASGVLTVSFPENTPYSYQITGILGNANEACDFTVSGAGIECLQLCDADNGTTTLNTGN